MDGTLRMMKLWRVIFILMKNEYLYMLLLFGDELELLSDLDRNIFLLTLRVRL
jgi:hypothetical protein